MTDIYIILKRNGWTFGSSFMHYVILNPQGEEVMREMNKRQVEQRFFDLSR